MSTLARITAPHFVAGVIIDGVVVKAAPIVRWAMGLDANELTRRVTRQGWGIEFLGAPVSGTAGV